MSLLCKLLWHNWKYKPHAIPEDRETLRCERCGDWAFHPAQVNETSVPAHVVEGARIEYQQSGKEY